MTKSTSGQRAKVARTTADATAKTLPLGMSAAAPMFKFAQDMRRWADNVLGVAGSASELSLNLAKARAKEPRQQQAIDKAGSMLRKAREAAGMTTRELGQAVDVTDPKLLEQAESGKAALPFEIILRLASVLGRHDPANFAMKLARSYNPALWKALDELGIGKLVALAEREREMANIYRANDAARALTDADFAEVLGFVKTGFDLAVKFRSGSSAGRKTARTQPAPE